MIGTALVAGSVGILIGVLATIRVLRRSYQELMASQRSLNEELTEFKEEQEAWQKEYPPLYVSFTRGRRTHNLGEVTARARARELELVASSGVRVDLVEYRAKKLLEI